MINKVVFVGNDKIKRINAGWRICSNPKGNNQIRESAVFYLDIFNASKGDIMGMYDLKNQSTRVLNRWRTPGQITDVPKANFRILPSTWFVEDGSYIRLQNVSLSYNFRGPFLDRIGITRLQPYFNATNLITLTRYTGMDPEVNQWGNNSRVQGIDWGTYPHSRRFVFGLNVEF